MRKRSVIAITALMSALLLGCLDDIEEASFDAADLDIESPEALIARVSDGTVYLEWNAVDGSDGYRIYRAAVQPVDFSSLGESPDTFYTDRDLVNGRTYYYSVAAMTEGGLEGPRSESIAATPLDSYAGIAGLSISPMPAIYSPGATVHFTMNVDNDEAWGEAWLQIEGFSIQVVLYDDGNGGDPSPRDGIYEADYRFPLSVRGIDLTVTGYFVDEAGNGAAPYEMENQISFSDPPEPVTLFGASDSTTSSITIRWDSSQEEYFRGYRIYRDRSTGVDADPALLVTTLPSAAQTSYTDQGLIEGATYYYRIFVVNDLDELAGSNERSASTYDAYPNPVVLDSLSAIGSDRLTLTWSRNENTDFLEYRIFRSTSPGVTDDMTYHIATIDDRTKTFYDDSGLDTQANAYYYRIYVLDAGGKATPSNEMGTP